jgi:hypothetical protein
MSRNPVSMMISAALLAAALTPCAVQATPHHAVVVADHRGYDPYWGRRYDGRWGIRHVGYRQPHIVYYDRRPEVIYVSGRPYRYHYHPQRRVYYYRDSQGRDIVLGAALGAVGIAAILVASR